MIVNTKKSYDSCDRFLLPSRLIVRDYKKMIAYDYFQGSNIGGVVIFFTHYFGNLKAKFIFKNESALGQASRAKCTRYKTVCLEKIRSGENSSTI